MSEEKLKGTTDQWRVIVHNKFQQDSKERSAASSVQIKVGQVLFVSKDLLRFINKLRKDSFMKAVIRVFALIGREMNGRVVFLVGFFEVREQISEPIIQSDVENELK